MNRRRWLTWIVVAWLSVVAARAGSDPCLERGFVVVLHERIAADEVTARVGRVVDAARDRLPSLRLKHDDAIYRQAIKGFAVRLDESDAANLDALREHPDVAFVAEDRALELHGQLNQPGMQRLRVRRNATAAVNDVDDVQIDVDIAVLDSGIDATHPDLNVYQSVSFVSGDPATGDPNGHGTHVAGIAAAIDDAEGIHGVAPGARLWSVRVVDAGGAAFVSDVIAGLEYVLVHADLIDVVNMSLGGPGLGDDGNCGATVGDPLHLAVCSVVEAGVIVVVSAGNYPPYGRDASLIIPAAYDEVITVSAIIETDGKGPGSAQGNGTIYGPDNYFAFTFSNYGWDVDIAAPGAEVISTWPGGGYVADSGTSRAAPHVAGAAALWIAKHGKPTDAQGVAHVRDELVRLGFPQLGPDEGFLKDKETFREPLLNVGAIDLGMFDPVEPELTTDQSVYAFGQDAEASITLHLLDQSGQPFDGFPGNGLLSYLGGKQQDMQFEGQGQGVYTSTLDIQGLLPGDHDFTVVLTTASGFERSVGCRVVIRNPTPLLLLHELEFLFPVMNYDSYFGTNSLHAALMDENGAPLVVPAEQFETVFSGGGPELTWSLPSPDPVTGVSPGITYGAHGSGVSGIHSLPLGTYYVDVSVTHQGLSDSGTASFEMAYHDPALVAELTSNLSSFDFTQPIPPPALNLELYVESEWKKGYSGLLYLVDEPFQLRLDGQAVPGVSFSEDPLEPGNYVAQAIDIAGLDHGTHQLVVHVIDHRGIEVDSNAVPIDVITDLGPCADPMAGPGQADSDGDGFQDACDNCPTVPNPSQADSGGAEGGLGDACKTQAKLSVSSAPADGADFPTIQQAVDAASPTSPVVRIEILPGSGPYTECVVVDRDQTFRFVGKNAPVVACDEPGGSAFDLRSTGTGPIGVSDLLLRGQGPAGTQRGVTAGIPTLLSRLTFENLGVGLDLSAAGHVVEIISADETVGTAVLTDGATLSLGLGEFRGTERVLRQLGASSQSLVEHVLVVGNGSGECIHALDGTLDLRHATLVGCGTAVTADAASLNLAHSVVWSNGTDLAGVSCSAVSWSDVQDVDCAGTNLSVDPLFVDPAEGDFHLQAASPLLDHGPDPASFTGMPCTDLDGSLRLRDHDGDGLARLDPGAYERENASITPPEVTGLIWTGPDTLEWNAWPEAVEYHIYRAPLQTLGYAAFGTCEDGLEAVRSDTLLTDGTIPATGTGFYYEITLEDASGEESTLGFGSCAERTNFDPCP